MTKQHLTIAEIRSKFPEEKRKLARANLWSYFIRPISFYPTWLFLRLGISANQVTFIGLIIGIIGCVFLGFGGYWAIITGAILINIHVLFDNIDGNIARATDSSSTYGDYIDRLSMYVIAGLMPITLGIGLYNHPDPHLNYLSRLLFGVGISNNIYLLLGILYSLFRIFRFLIAEEFGLTFSIKPTDFYKPKDESKRSLWGVIYTVGCSLQILVLPILLVFATANALSIFIAFYALVTVFELIAVTGRTLIMARKIEGAINK